MQVSTSSQWSSSAPSSWWTSFLVCSLESSQRSLVFIPSFFSTIYLDKRQTCEVWKWLSLAIVYEIMNVNNNCQSKRRIISYIFTNYFKIAPLIISPTTNLCRSERNRNREEIFRRCAPSSRWTKTCKAIRFSILTTIIIIIITIIIITRLSGFIIIISSLTIIHFSIFKYIFFKDLQGYQVFHLNRQIIIIITKFHVWILRHPRNGSATARTWSSRWATPTRSKLRWARPRWHFLIVLLRWARPRWHFLIFCCCVTKIFWMIGSTYAISKTKCGKTKVADYNLALYFVVFFKILWICFMLFADESTWPEWSSDDGPSQEHNVPSAASLRRWQLSQDEDDYIFSPPVGARSLFNIGNDDFRFPWYFQ